MADQIVSTFPTATPLSTDLVPIEHQSGGTGPYTSSVTTVAALVAAGGGGGGSGAFGSSTDVDFTTEGTNKFLTSVASGGKPFSFQTPTGSGSAVTIGTIPRVVQGQSNGNTGTASHPLVLPYTAGVGNLLLAFANCPSGTTITTPTGYTLLISTTQNSMTVAIFYRVATGTSSDNPTINYSASGNNESYVFEFAGAGVPVVTAGGAAGAYLANSPQITAPANSLVLAQFMNGSTSYTTAPSPEWTSFFLAGSGRSNIATTPVPVLTVLSATLSWAGTAGACNIIAIPGSSVPAATATVEAANSYYYIANSPSSFQPWPTVAGQFLVVCVMAASLGSTPSGWTLVHTQGSNIGIYTKTAAGGSSADAFNFSGFGALCAMIEAFDNVVTGIVAYGGSSTAYASLNTPAGASEVRVGFDNSGSGSAEFAPPWVSCNGGIVGGRQSIIGTKRFHNAHVGVQGQTNNASGFQNNVIYAVQ